jgi:hypothetical protein
MNLFLDWIHLLHPCSDTKTKAKGHGEIEVDRMKGKSSGHTIT